MTESSTGGSTVRKFASTPGIQWAAGLAVAVILSLLLALIVVAVTNEWVLLVLLMILGMIVAVAVGFAVRLTSAGAGAFWPAAVATGLGVHTLVSLAGVGFDDYGHGLLSAFGSAPISAYVVFYGVIAGVIAAFARRP